VSCETVTTVFVSRPPPCTGGNEARGVSAGSSIVETAGSVREEPEAEHHLRVEKALKGKCALGPFLSILVIKCPTQVPKC
jgi:hypothetical protein